MQQLIPCPFSIFAITASVNGKSAVAAGQMTGVRENSSAAAGERYQQG